jgi:hypothetical protein
LAAAILIALLITTPAIITLVDPAQPPLFSVSPMSPGVFAASFVVGNLVLGLFVIVLGLWLEPRVGLGTPLLRAWLQREPGLPKVWRAAFSESAVWGVVLGATVLLGGLLGRAWLPSLPDGLVLPPVWQGLLLILGAALREEVLFRLGAMNLLAWLGAKLTRQATPSVFVVWLANITVSLVFAFAHLIPATEILELSALARVLVPGIAAVAGIVFGYIYARHGLTAAVVSHAVAGTIVYLGARFAMSLST